MCNYRDLPDHIPTLIPLTLRRGEHNGKKQWVGYYQPASSRHPCDLMKVVVNVSAKALPFAGQRWLVQPLHLAPKADIMFAKASKPAEGL